MNIRTSWGSAMVLAACACAVACSKKKDDAAPAASGAPATAAPAAAPSTWVELVGSVDVFYRSPDGTLKSWGWGGDLIGDGTKDDRDKPTALAELAGVKQMGSSNQTACAVLKDGSVKCWGNGASGELGDIKVKSSDKPVAVPGVTNAVEVQLGDYFACARISDGHVKCWGSNSWKQAGPGQPDKAPVNEIAGVTDATQLALSGSTSCALTKSGQVQCWGLDCGAEGPNDCEKPYTVPQLAGAVQVAGGWQSICVVMKDGSAKCWGSNNEYGQLGNGNTKMPEGSGKIFDVVGLKNVASIAMGQQHACALLKDGSVQCWGNDDHGQLGDGTKPKEGEKETGRGTPAPVKGLTNVAQLALASSTSCALTKDGKLKCWGENNGGKLFGAAHAEDSSEDVTEPVDVPLQ